MNQSFKTFFVLFTFICTSIYAQKIDEKLKYLKQETPSNTPIIFAPGVISKENQLEFGSVFSKDGTQFFYGVSIKGKSEIRYCQFVNNNWSTPKTIISHNEYGYNDPFLSPNEDRLYYISNMPLKENESKGDHDIWYSVKEKSGWSKPTNAGKNINSDKNEYYMSFTNDGTMYFSSDINDQKNEDNFDIYYSKYVNNEFKEKIKLSDSINSRAYEADVFISPDESYMIFCANRNNGLGRGDLYISFKKDNGTWTESKNMGNNINTRNHELCPFVTNDGKYLFYTSNEDIYWVSADIINKYK